MLIDKQFHGDLEGSSKGEMLSIVFSGGEGLGGLCGNREGFRKAATDAPATFVLQHSGTMTRGVPAAFGQP